MYNFFVSLLSANVLIRIPSLYIFITRGRESICSDKGGRQEKFKSWVRRRVLHITFDE